MRKLLPALILLFSLAMFAQTSNEPPVLSATGDQIYCPGTPTPVVTSMSITDPDDTTTEAVYIQISSGYVSSQDLLTLTGTHPGITAYWDATAGKLTLRNPSNTPLPYTDFIAAIQAVVYTNNSASASGVRTFSITVGQANYLPSTDHYYQFIPSLGISWTAARTAAENSTYYGLQGYLATILSSDEAQLSGEQSEGAGWIGGSDSQTEGVWRWMTGPEAGQIFWNNGVTTIYAFWNTGEPNNAGDEDYAHVTAPGVGLTGSWNDLSNTGEASGDYQPKGYIVEYGGMPGDPVLNISTSTTITIPSLNSPAGASACGPSALTLNANASNGNVHWYDSATGGNLLFTGNSFTTPVLNESTTYYASAFPPSCTTATRTAVNAVINDIPQVTILTPAPSCEGVVTIEATTNTGTIEWFTEAVGGTSIHTGSTFTTPVLTESTVYYAEAISPYCTGNREMVTAMIYQKPDVSDENDIGICEGGSATLDAGLNDVSYLWSPGGQTTRTITVSSPGQYSVTVTTPAPENCSAVKNFIVLQKNVPAIIGAVAIGNELTIYTSNSGDFEYSVDGVNYQLSPVFIIDGSPIEFLYARSIHDCGGDQLPFTNVVRIPTLFTPNADGFHDVWTISGMIFYPNAKVSIFDRYGKLLTVLSRENLSWDGTFNGSLLPATDYWFVADIDATLPQVKGHFSLKR